MCQEPRRPLGRERDVVRDRRDGHGGRGAREALDVVGVDVGPPLLGGRSHRGTSRAAEPAPRPAALFHAPYFLHRFTPCCECPCRSCPLFTPCLVPHCTCPPLSPLLPIQRGVAHRQREIFHPHRLVFLTSTVYQFAPALIDYTTSIFMS